MQRKLDWHETAMMICVLISVVIILHNVIVVICPAKAQDLRQDPKDIPVWVMPTDHPDKSTIIRLDTLSPDFSFEFWIGGDSQKLTKTQLAQAIELFYSKRWQTEKTACVLGPNGEVLNYPCRVKKSIGEKKK